MKKNKIVGATLINKWIQTKDCISYSDFAKEVGLSTRKVSDYFEDVSFFCVERGLPPISAIVINKETGMCGNGFFKTYYPHAKQKDYMKIFFHDIERIQRLDCWNFVRDEYVKC